MSIIIPISKIDLAVDASSCVYTLYNNGVAIYVGQSINLLARLANHRSFKEFDSFSFFNVEIESLDDAESAEIARVKPTGNKTMPANNLFVSDKTFIKELNETVVEKLKCNASFIGCDRAEKKGGIIYIDKEFTSSFMSYILAFQLKAEVK